jgi:hypothetical protein
VVALRTAERDDVIALLRERVGEKKFQLPRLVAAGREPRWSSRFT